MTLCNAIRAKIAAFLMGQQVASPQAAGTQDIAIASRDFQKRFKALSLEQIDAILDMKLIDSKSTVQ